MDLAADEIKRLQSCINNLISVLALPALWGGSEPSQMVGTLLDVLLAMLRLDFAYARLSDWSGGPPIEAVRSPHRQHPSVGPQQVGQALGRWLTGDQSASRLVVPNPAEEGEVSIASFSLGLQDEVGVLVAGSQRRDFPTDIERLLLRVATNQAGIGLQEARRSGEQKRIAEALEQQVAERTRQLTAVNEELRHSKAYLAEAQRLSRTGSFGWRVSTGEILWSEETFRIFRYDRTTTPTLERVLQRVHPEDAALVTQTIERASQEGKNFDVEHRLLMPDGAVIYVRVMADAVRDESGGLEFVGALMDVTAAREAEDRTRLIIDTVPGLLWTVRPDGRVDFVSQRWLDYTRLTLEQGLGCGWESVYHPDDLEHISSKWRAALAEGKPHEAEARLRRFDGAYRWFLCRAFPLFDGSGHILGWYGSATDIHDRKQAEEKLRQTETELRQLIDVIPQQVVVFDANWSPLFANQRELAYTGLTLQEVQSRDAFAKTFHPEDLKKLEVIRERGSSEGTPFEMEARIRGRDGQYRWFLIRDSPLRNEQGRVLQWYGTRTDIEDRKRAEETVRQAQADLAHVSRVTTMGELTASLAHEVKQPIAAALTDAKTCVRWLARDTPAIEEARAAAMRIVEDGTRAADIIGRIRLLFTKGSPERALIDVNDIIRDLIVLLRSEATRYAISVRTELAADLPPVMGDRVQLQQVMMNLIMNSIDAMKAVEGTREIAIASQRAENGHVLVSVSDTGVGLPRQQADQIFNAFFTTKRQGIGMGLSISRSIVESHDGRLWAADNAPRGARFCFTLPTESRHMQ